MLLVLATLLTSQVVHSKRGLKQCAWIWESPDAYLVGFAFLEIKHHGAVQIKALPRTRQVEARQTGHGPRTELLYV